MKQLLFEYSLIKDDDFIYARSVTRKISSFLGLKIDEQNRISTAISELVQNSLLYAKDATISFNLISETNHFFLEIELKDKGPGIEDLPSILEGTYTSSSGEGLGLMGAKKLLPDLQIQTEASGTRILYHQILNFRQSHLNESEIQTLHQVLLTISPTEEFKRQNQELMFCLSQYKEMKSEHELLNHELSETNDGVMALYNELQTAIKSREDMLALVSHDLRNPLMIINLQLRLMEKMFCSDKDRAPTLHPQLDRIHRACSDMKTLIQDLLDISSMETGSFKIQLSPLDSLSVMKEAELILADMVRDKQIEIEIESRVDGPGISILADKGRLIQALSNLFTNAVKFTDNGGKITLRQSVANNHLLFSVKDNGSGISECDIPFVFDRYWKGPDNNFKGSIGLGLSIVKGIALAHGGKVQVQSTKGQGSEFSLCLPL